MVSNIPFPSPVGAVRIGKVDGNFVVNPTEDGAAHGRPRPRRLRHRRGDPDGRGRRQRDPRGRDPRRARHRPRRDQEALRRDARARREGRRRTEARGRHAPTVDDGLLRPDQGVARRGAGRGATSVQDKPSARTPRRPSRRRCSRTTPATRAAESYAENRKRAQLAFDKLEKNDDPPAHRRPQEAPGRPSESTRSARSRSRSACCRAPTARRCSRAARRRPSRWSRSAPRARRCAWTRSGSRRPSATSTTTTSRPSRSGEAGFMRGPKRRDIGHGALAERALVPMIPSQEDVPLHDSRRVGHPRVQRLLVDGLGLRLLAVADGRGRADQVSRSPASPWA